MGLLRRIAKEALGEEKAKVIWDRIEIIGDIAVIKSPSIAGERDPLGIEEYRRVAQALLGELKYLRSVWLARAPTHGDYRIREMVHLAGEKRSETVYKEHGCLFKVDITKVFITPRLNYEHLRIASLVKPREVIVNMFAGAGLFSIIIAKKAQPKIVYSIDINPDAYKYMVENIKLNKVEDKVVPYLGDAARVIEEHLVGVADRVLMPLPELALDYAIYALKALKARGTIHFYLHIKALRGENPIALAKNIVEARLNSLGASMEASTGRIVRKVGPRTYQVVIDAKVAKQL